MSQPSLTNCPKLRPSFGPLHCGVSSLLSFTASAVLALFMFFCVLLMSSLFQVAIAAGSHLFPSRTEKLSPRTPMVLRKRESR